MEKSCEYCGEQFNAKRSHTKFCSRNCQQMAYFKRNGFKPKSKEWFERTDLNESTNPIPALKIVKGDLFHTIKRVQRTQDLLNFSQAILWPDKNFCEAEQIKLKLLLAEHFRDSKDIDLTFRELVERTVLAKRWVEEKEYRTMLSPKDWFNIDRIDGLYFTHRLYGRMLTQRNTIPSYELALTIFSEAILRYCEHKNVLDIYSYREKFIKLYRMDLLQYYFNAIMHIQFINLQPTNHEN